MKTQDEVHEAVMSKDTWERESCAFVDGRDLRRLANFFHPDKFLQWGPISLKEGVDPREWETVEWTEDNVKAQLEVDLRFAFEKATSHKGISSAMMFDVIRMWLWILEDEVYEFDRYSDYGIPLYKRVAKKYDLPDTSDEYFD